MNDFDYTIKLQQIKDCKTLACAKNFIIQAYGNANYNYRNKDTDTYYPFSSNFRLVIIENKMNYFNLFKKGRDKYVELGGDINKLPKYAKNNSFSVNITMPFEKAYELLTTKKIEL